MTDANDVFLTTMIASLDIAGTIVRSAWGRTTRCRTCHRLSPSAAAASRWVCFTDSRPPRMISAMNAISFSAIPMIAVAIALVRIPMSGRTLYQNSNWSRIGVPRITQMNGTGTQRTARLRDIRMRARPSAKGSAAMNAAAEISIAMSRPCHRNPSVR